MSNVNINSLCGFQAERFVESRNRLLNEFNNEYYTSISEHQKGRQEISEHHLLDSDDSFDAHIYTDKKTTAFNSLYRVMINKRYNNQMCI